MSETRLQVTLIGAVAAVALLLIASVLSAAMVVYLTIGLAALLFLGLIGIAWRKWQHSSLPLREDKRERQRLAHEQEMERERLRMERDQHEHQKQLEREQHEQQLQLDWQRFQLEQHLALTRLPASADGYPALLGLDPQTAVTTVPYQGRPQLLSEGKGQRQLPPQADTESAPPAPVDVYTLIAYGRRQDQRIAPTAGAAGALPPGVLHLFGLCAH